MKYVMLKHKFSGVHEALFCASPDRAANAAEAMRLRWSPLLHSELLAAFARTHDAVSAGYCEIQPDGSVRTFGLSASLDLKPGPDDARILAEMMRVTAAKAPVLPVGL